MTKVVVKDGNVDLAIRKFSAKFAKSGVPSNLKKKKYYEKPGVTKRKEKEENKKNSRKSSRNY